MSKQTFNPRFLVLLAIIIVVGASRVANAALVTPWISFSAVGAIALFGGSYFTNQWKAFLFPVLILLLSDLAISFFVFRGKYGILYGGWYWTYGIFLLIVWLGRLIIRKVTVKNVIIASLSATLLLWLLSDFRVWIGGGLDLRTMKPLSRGIDGLIQCYIQGFPFMRSFLAGTLLYSGIMYGSFEWLKRRNPKFVLAVSNENEQ